MGERAHVMLMWLNWVTGSSDIVSHISGSAKLIFGLEFNCVLIRLTLETWLFRNTEQEQRKYGVLSRPANIYLCIHAFTNAIHIIYSLRGAEETNRISLILQWGGIQNSNISTSFCLSSNYILRIMDETFFVVSVMAVSFEIYKTDDKNKFYCKCFLAPKLTYTKIFFSCCSTLVSKKYLLKNLSILHFSDSMRIIQNSIVSWKFYLSINLRKKSLNYLKK